MTKKRKHQLERNIRREYSQFEIMLIGRDNSNRIITQLYNLLWFKIEYKKLIGVIDYSEVVFMKQCNIKYMSYYHKMMEKIYG